MSLEEIRTGRERRHREPATGFRLERFRFCRVWCPIQRTGCHAVIRIENGVEVDVRQCSLHEGGGELTCERECLD
jgi:hypothetical protein